VGRQLVTPSQCAGDVLAAKWIAAKAMNANVPMIVVLMGFPPSGMLEVAGVSPLA